MSIPGYMLRPVQSADIPALSDLLYKSKLSLAVNFYSKTGQMKLYKDETTLPPLKVWIYLRLSLCPLWTMKPETLSAILP